MAQSKRPRGNQGEGDATQTSAAPKRRVIPKLGTGQQVLSKYFGKAAPTSATPSASATSSTTASGSGVSPIPMSNTKSAAKQDSTTKKTSETSRKANASKTKVQIKGRGNSIQNKKTKTKDLSAVLSLVSSDEEDSQSIGNSIAKDDDKDNSRIVKPAGESRTTVATVSALNQEYSQMETTEPVRKSKQMVEIETPESLSTKHVESNATGKISSSTLASRLHAIDAATDQGGNNDVDEDNSDEEEAAAADLQMQNGQPKLTPLEKQWKDLKDEYPDVLLCVECGYKYRLFQEDAKIASQVLSIAAFPRHAFLTASFPVHRLHVHVRRLVESGYLVGIVTQTETAALKKQSSTRSKLFTRELSALYSRATLLPDAMLDVVPSVQGPGSKGFTGSNAGTGGESNKKQNLLSSGWVKKNANKKSSKSDNVDEEENADEDNNEEGFNEEDTEQDLALDMVAENNIQEEEERYILAIWELDVSATKPVLDIKQGWALGEPRPEATNVTLGLFAVDIRSGTLVYEAFVDDAERTTLIEKLEHLDPYEYILAGPTMSRTTEEAIIRKAQPVERKRRIDRVRFSQLTSPETYLRQIYTGDTLKLVQTQLPLVLQAALACLIHYLEPFKLQRVLRDASSFVKDLASRPAAVFKGNDQNSTPHSQPQTLAARQYMHLDPSALHDLEIIAGRGGPTYSLVSFLSRHALTPMGSRLLKRWILQPLLEVNLIKERQEAIAALSHESSNFSPLIAALRQLKRFDIERNLEQVVHARCSPANFLRLLDNICELTKVLSSTITTSRIKSDHALYAILQSAGAGSIGAKLGDLVAGLNRDECSANNLGKMFANKSAYPDIFHVKFEIENLHDRFDQELEKIRDVLKKPKLQYRTLRTGFSASLEYLIELPKAEAVPRDWNEVSSTQRVSRYVTPTIEDLLDQLARRREELEAVAKSTWKKLLEEFSDQYRGTLRDFAHVIAQIDALFALSKISELPGFVLPNIEVGGANGGAFIFAQRARHPLLDMLSVSHTDCVPNDLALGDAPSDLVDLEDVDMTRVMLVTGPNMGGKSSYTRTAAVCIILSQIGAHVPAESCRVGVFDAIRVRMGVREDPGQGMSTFMVEMRQAATIFNQATSRTLCILDELGRGTSTFDGTAIALASLRYICGKMKAPCLFITHYTQLGTLLDEFPRSTLAAMHMAYHETEDGKLVFLYQATSGLASQSYGLHVAHLAGLPERVIAAARDIKRTRET